MTMMMTMMRTEQTVMELVDAACRRKMVVVRLYGHSSAPCLTTVVSAFSEIGKCVNRSYFWCLNEKRSRHTLLGEDSQCVPGTLLRTADHTFNDHMQCMIRKELFF